MVDGLQDLTITVGGDLGPLAQALNQIPALARQAGEAAASALASASSGGANVDQAFQRAADASKTLADAMATTTTAAQALDRELQQKQADVAKTEQGFQDLGRTISQAGQGMMLLGGILSGVSAGIIGLGVESLQAAGKFEQWQVAFTTLTGSAESARSMLAELVDFAQRTPFTIPGVIDEAQRLMAFGIAAKDIIPILTTLGDAASATGKGAIGLHSLVLALGEMNEKGTVQMRQMNMMINQGVDAIGILAKAYDVSTREISDMISKRLVSASEAIPLLLQGINEKSGGMMAEQAKTFLGMLSNLQDAATKTFAAIGNTLLPVAKEIENALFAILKQIQAAAEWFAQLPKPIQEAAIVMGVLAAAIGPIVLALGTMVFAIGQLMTTLPAIVTVLGTFASALGVTGLAVGAFALIIGGALTGAVLGWREGMSQITALEDQFKQDTAGMQAAAAARAKGMDDTASSIQVLVSTILKYNETAKDKIQLPTFDPNAKDGINDYKKALEDLVAKVPAVKKGLFDLSGALDQLGASNVNLPKSLGVSWDPMIQGMTGAQREVENLRVKQLELEGDSIRALDVYNQAGARFGAASAITQKAQVEYQKSLDALHPKLKQAGTDFDDLTKKVVSFGDEAFKALSKMPADFGDFLAGVGKGVNFKGIADQFDSLIAKAEQSGVAFTDAGSAMVEALRDAAEKARGFLADLDFAKEAKKIADAAATATEETLSKIPEDLRRFIDKMRGESERMKDVWAALIPADKIVSGMIKAQEDLDRSEATMEQDFMASLKRMHAEAVKPIKINVSFTERIGELAAQFLDMQSQMNKFGLNTQGQMDAIIGKTIDVARSMESMNQPLFQQLQLWEKIYQLQIQQAIEQGKSSEYVLALTMNLEEARIKQEALRVQSQGLSDLYVGMIKAFGSAWSELEKGIADAIVSGQNFGEVFTKVLDDIKKSISELVVKFLMDQLKTALLVNTGLLEKFNSIFKGLFGAGSGGAGAGASVAGAAGEATKSAGGASNFASSAVGSSLTGAFTLLTQVLDLVNGIVQTIKLVQIEKTLALIEVSTRRMDIIMEQSDGLLFWTKTAGMELQTIREEIQGNLHNALVAISSNLDGIAANSDEALPAIKQMLAILEKFQESGFGKSGGSNLSGNDQLLQYIADIDGVLRGSARTLTDISYAIGQLVIELQRRTEAPITEEHSSDILTAAEETSVSAKETSAASQESAETLTNILSAIVNLPASGGGSSSSSSSSSSSDGGGGGSTSGGDTVTDTFTGSKDAARAWLKNKGLSDDMIGSLLDVKDAVNDNTQAVAQASTAYVGASGLLNFDANGMVENLRKLGFGSQDANRMAGEAFAEFATADANSALRQQVAPGVYSTPGRTGAVLSGDSGKVQSYMETQARLQAESAARYQQLQAENRAAQIEARKSTEDYNRMVIAFGGGTAGERAYQAARTNSTLANMYGDANVFGPQDNSNRSSQIDPITGRSVNIKQTPYGTVYSGDSAAVSNYLANQALLIQEQNRLYQERVAETARANEAIRVLNNEYASAMSQFSLSIRDRVAELNKIANDAALTQRQRQAAIDAIVAIDSSGPMYDPKYASLFPQPNYGFGINGTSDGKQQNWTGFGADNRIAGLGALPAMTPNGGGVTINVTGNTILDNATANSLANTIMTRVTQQLRPLMK